MWRGWGGKFWWRSVKGGDYLEDVGADGKVILKLMFKKCNKEDMDWNELAQDRNRWHIACISE